MDGLQCFKYHFLVDVLRWVHAMLIWIDVYQVFVEDEGPNVGRCNVPNGRWSRLL